MSENKKEPLNNNRIKKVRLERDKTQRDLANLLGVSEQAIAYYEKALREPPLRSWIKLADYLGVSVSYLQGISKYPTEEIMLQEEMREEHERNTLIHNPENFTVDDLEELYKRIDEDDKARQTFADDSRLEKYLALSNVILENISSKTERNFYMKWEKQIKSRKSFADFSELIHHIFRMFIFSSSGYDEISKTYYTELKALVKKYDEKENSYFDN